MFNSFFSASMQFSKIFLPVFFILVGFYHFFKRFIFQIAPSIASRSNLTATYPHAQIVGLIELVIIAVCHVLFCASLLFVFDINVKSIFLNVNLIDCLFGVLIGIGAVGISVLFCTIAIKFFEYHARRKGVAPKTLNEWSSISGAGWIRHHKHTIKILPISLAVLIITMQVGSEETIFRSVLLQAFHPFGVKTAFIVATSLFIYMQTFHMPSMLSAMFPIIGATVMGIIHGLLYLYYPSMTPLIISHLAFFLFTVI